MKVQCPNCKHCFQVVDVDGVMAERKLLAELREQWQENDRLKAMLEECRKTLRENHEQQQTQRDGPAA